jgi:8-oxo-dGTP diphosphatase
MPIPEFIAGLRAHVGHDTLWLPSVSAVVVNDAGEILLGQRADTGRWSLICGVAEPGEQPAVAVVREVLEETGVHVAPERISSVVAHPMTYPNGDRCEYMNIAFRCRPIGGAARVNDDESLAVGWFPPDQMPALDAHSRLTVKHALGDATQAWYVEAGPR